jgi:hypothetical protein
MTDNLPAPAAPFAIAKVGAGATAATPPPVCHRCGAVATVQWPRKATDAEREQHFDAQEQHIREQPNLFGPENAEYVADRTAPVTKAVHGCDEHDLSPAPADGSKKAAAAAKQAGVEARALTHDADCGGHGECRCGGVE